MSFTRSADTNKIVNKNINTELGQVSKQSVRQRPLSPKKDVMQSRVPQKKLGPPNTLVSVETEVSQKSEETAAKTTKPTLVNSKLRGKRKKGKPNKKRVRFSDTEPAESIPLGERVVRFFVFLWTCTAAAAKSALIDSELEELGEQLPRYRPDSIAALRRLTRFTEPELKRLYRGFKAECPTGVVKEDTFKVIYSQFFPQGANTAQYAHHVFNTFDQDRSGLLSFEEFVTGLSVLSRGTLEEKLRWTFTLYDINGDGCVTKEEMTEIVSAVYDLMGRVVDPVDDEVVRDKVERLFHKMDLNRDGVVTLDEFLDCCIHDEGITRSMGVFDSNF